MLRNLATSLVIFETIDTTEAKAKETKSYVEKILSSAKTSDFNTVRTLKKIFFDKNAVIKVVEELIPRYESRKSGFIKSYRLKNRPGDNSPMMRLELIDKKKFIEKDEKKVAEKTSSETTNTKVKVTENGK